MKLELNFQKSQGDFNLILEKVNLEGFWTAVFGHSGCGKSTLLECVSGMRQIDTGSVILDGKILCNTESGINLKLEERQLGCVTQDGQLFPHMTVEQNLKYGWDLRPGPIKPEQVAEILDISDFLDRRPSEISGGQAQRVSLARALCSNPALLLIDEPLASLDASMKSRIILYLERIKVEFRIPALHVTHEAAEVHRLADHVLVLESGKLLRQGTPAEVF
jgi:molybdate transport system ATP-binding protein